jgi:hypothetical protein
MCSTYYVPHVSENLTRSSRRRRRRPSNNTINACVKYIDGGHCVLLSLFFVPCVVVTIHTVLVLSERTAAQGEDRRSYYMRFGWGIVHWALMQAPIMAASRKMGEGGYSNIFKTQMCSGGIKLSRLINAKKTL